MKLNLTVVLLLFSLYPIQAQPIPNQQDTNSQSYIAELKSLGKNFSNDFYPHYVRIYSLPEKRFIGKIDSIRKIFNAVLAKYQTRLNSNYVQVQQKEIQYYRKGA